MIKPLTSFYYSIEKQRTNHFLYLRYTTIFTEGAVQYWKTEMTDQLIDSKRHENNGGEGITPKNDSSRNHFLQRITGDIDLIKTERIYRT